MRIAHISDLHISGPYYVPEWGNKLKKNIQELNPELIIITGDLTDWGYLHEYEIATEYIEQIECECKRLIVPGNHDARNKGYEIFEEIFKTRYPVFENNNICVVGVDSSEPDLDEGHVGREHYPLIKDKFNSKKLKIIALHHHVIPIPGTGRERNILIDAGDFLKLCIELNVKLVLSGHKHLPWMWNVEKSCFITTGTACSCKLKGRSYPSFNIIDIESDLLTINEINILTDDKKIILKTEGNIL